MSRRRFWPGTTVFDISPPPPPPPVDVRAELQRLAEIARHGRELAELIANARRPLPDIDDDAPREFDAAIEAMLAEQVERDAELRASAAELSRSWPPRRRPRRPPPAPAPVVASGRRRRRRGFVVRPAPGVVLDARGRFVKGGWPLVNAALSGDVIALHRRPVR